MTRNEFKKGYKEMINDTTSKFSKVCLVVCCGITLTTLDVVNGVIETGKAVVETIRG